jgi:hypothetical protein
VSTRPILESIDYTISRDGQTIELLVEAVYISFVEEEIPDGQMAGMKGHRPVRNERSISYDLHPDQARMLRDQLDAALFGLEDR